MVEHECVQVEKIEDINHRLIIREQRGQFREERLDRLEQKLDGIIDSINELKIQRANYLQLIEDNKQITEEISEIKQQLAELETAKNTSKWFIGAIGVVLGFAISVVGWFI